jgi:HPt (histidine-containing phosphotransfer) domain-containing protein
MSDQNDVQDLDAQLLKQMLQDFLEEALELLDQLNLNLIQLEDEPDNTDLINQIFRIAHTIKGSAGFAGLEDMSRIGRKMEEVFGEVRKGSLKVTPPFIGLMFSGLDLLSTLRERATAHDSTPVAIDSVLQQFDHYIGQTASAASPPAKPVATEAQRAAEHQSATDELLLIFKDGYDQLAALKHLVYSSVHLYDEDTLAVLFSREIKMKMRPEHNSVWLVKKDKIVVPVARDGKLVAEGDRQKLPIADSPALTKVIKELLAVWSSSYPEIRELVPDFQSPIILPIKSHPQAYGFLVLDPEESTEIEMYQFVAEFMAMILKISKLHYKVEAQRKELDEMTAILFRQNNILSSLYHVELDLMRVTDPIDLCRIVVEAFVHDLESRTAAIFLKDENGTQLRGVWGSGGLKDIPTLQFPLDGVKQFQQCLDSGRIVSHSDSTPTLQVGVNSLDNWMVMGLKGREKTHGVIVAELDIDDVTDSMSILANYCGIMLDTLFLEKKAAVQR